MGRMARDRQAWTEFVEMRDALSKPDARSTPSRPTSISFTVLTKPAPQGSMSGVAITRDDGSPGTIFKCDNKRTHPYRNQVGFEALKARAAAEVYDIFAAAGTPVKLALTFVFARPKTCPKQRIYPVVKPDLDKLCRSTLDALTGILLFDDAQVAEISTSKIYGVPERVVIHIEIIEENHYVFNCT